MFRYQIGPDAHVRIFEPRDAEALFAVVEENRAGLRQWLPWLDDNRSVADSNAFIRGALRKYADNGAFDAGIWHQGRLAGAIGFHPISWSNKNVSVGYWLAHHARGKGLMTRACGALVEHALVDLRLHRIEIRCGTGNPKSQRIPRLLGFKEEGVARQSEWLYDRWVDHVVFAMLAQEWRARAKETSEKSAAHSGSQ
jgi:ribosomal-protein-serine acetyltransferase